MLYHDPAAKTHDRMGFTLSMAIALHVAVILGVGFVIAPPGAPSSTRMDITLSNYTSDEPVLDADFVAQTNQEASGSESEKSELKTTELAAINSSSIQKINPEVLTPSQQLNTQRLQVVTTTADSLTQAQSTQKDTKRDQENLQGQDDRLRRQLEMASLKAKLDEQEQVYARLPRIRRTSSVATKAAADAEYLYHWQRRIESIGNEHYPQEARRQKIFGNVRILVSVNADGSLKDVKVLGSSGHKVLDDAALKIVRLSAPFKPFPPEIKETTDVLEIIRTWQFSKDQFSHQ